MGGGKSEAEDSSYQEASGQSESNSSFTGEDQSSTGSNFAQDVWGQQSPFLQDLYGQAQNIFGQQQAGMGEATEGVQNYFDQINQGSMPAWQQQLQGGAFQDMDLQKRMGQLLDEDTYQQSNAQAINNMVMGGQGNNYADAMRNQYVDDANRASDNMLANLDARATASGMSGGARHGTAIARGMDDINRNLQGEMADLGYESFDKDLNRKLAIAGQADANNLARFQGKQQSLQDMMGSQQAGMQGGLDFGANMQNLGMGSFAPGMQQWNNLNAYGGALGGPLLLSGGSQFGTSSGTQKALEEAYNNWTSAGEASSESKSSHGGVGH